MDCHTKDVLVYHFYHLFSASFARNDDEKVMGIDQGLPPVLSRSLQNMIEDLAIFDFNLTQTDSN